MTAYTDEKTSAYESLVCIEARRALARTPMKLQKGVSVRIQFWFHRPKSEKKRERPSVKPDLDNLIKAVLDGCSQAGVWRDDAQVVSLVAQKLYGEENWCVIVLSETHGGDGSHLEIMMRETTSPRVLAHVAAALMRHAGNQGLSSEEAAKITRAVMTAPTGGAEA